MMLPTSPPTALSCAVALWVVAPPVTRDDAANSVVILLRVIIHNLILSFTAWLGVPFFLLSLVNDPYALSNFFPLSFPQQSPTELHECEEKQYAPGKRSLGEPRSLCHNAHKACYASKPAEPQKNSAGSHQPV
jgi:hypothetical protein